MGINFNKTFGAQSNNVASASKDDRPKSQFWLNIGYDSGVKDDEGNSRFVSLPAGIPLDESADPLPTNSRNAEYAAFNAARNDLHDQIMAVAKDLKPGEERMLNLSIQLRRVNGEAAPVTREANPFAKNLSL